MKDTKLVNLLQDFSPEDFRQIQKMVKSPFYTTNNNLVTLFSLLRTAHPQFDSNKLEKKTVFRKLFPKHDYSDIKLRNLIRDLVRIIEDYLIQKEVKSNDFERKKMLLKIYKKQGRLDWFERELKKLYDELEQAPYRDSIYYKHMMDLKLSQLEYLESKKPDSRFALLEEWERMLDHYYKLSKARHKITLKSLKKIIRPSENNIDHSVEGASILMRLYDRIDQLYDTDDLELFKIIKTDFEENIHLIRPNFQVEFLSLLINFAIKQMTIDDEKYNKVVLELYKLGLDNQLIFTTNRISDTNYFNIVVCGAKAKDFDWTLNFIERYEEQLSPLTKTDLKNISLATFYFHKKEFSKSIDLLITHSFKHAQLKVTARTLAIRCYYELYLQDSSYYELLIAQISSNERFIRRNEKLTEEQLKSNLNFLAFIKKIATIRLSGPLKLAPQKALTEELSNQKITLSRSWLIEIIKR